MIGSFFQRLFGAPADRPFGPLATFHAATFEEYARFYYSMTGEYARRTAIELGMIGAEAFTVEGLCYVCRKPSTFTVDMSYSDGEVIDGKQIPNWREHVRCSQCGLSNRIRASIHFLEQNLGCRRDARIYISEQTTPLYQHLQQHYPKLVGSEYFGARIPFGTNDPVTGYRNESATALTFAADSLDYMLSFDVYEHIPDYAAALRECHRCLRRGGKLLFTVPFNKGAVETEVRARLAADGSIEHLLEPIYHGDPINAAEGCLCYYIFGWDVLAQLRALGFRKAEAHVFWSREYAYLGGEGILLTAEK